MNRQFSLMLAGTATLARRDAVVTDRRRTSAYAPAVRPAVAAPQRPRASVRDRRCAAYRINVTARVFAGSVGAYAVAAALGALLARLLPMARPEAVMTGTLAALLVFPAVTIAAFLARSPARALGGVVTAAVALGILALALPLPPA